jgi:hypothetical protein
MYIYIYINIFVIAVIGRHKIFEYHLLVVLCTNKEVYVALRF